MQTISATAHTTPHKAQQQKGYTMSDQQQELSDIDPDTAITAFVGWLTSRDEISGPFSFRHDASDAVRLVKMFCEAQGWNSSLTRFHRQIEILKKNYPKEEYRG